MKKSCFGLEWGSKDVHDEDGPVGDDLDDVKICG